MKKLIALLLTLTMLLTCACQVSFAEENTDAKTQELEAVFTWMTQDMSEEDAPEILTWDRETVLAKLDTYDQPLEYYTKEEIADQFLAMTGMFSFFRDMVENAEGSTPSEFFGSIIGSLMSGLMPTEITSGSDAPDWADVNDDGTWEYEIMGLFDGTVWQSGDAQIATNFEEGQYHVTITWEGSDPVSYWCEYDEYEENDSFYYRLTGTDETGEQLFVTEDGRTLTWTQPDGTVTEYTLMVDTLTLYRWYTDGKELSIEWNGDNGYTVRIDGGVNGDYWTYDCLMDDTGLTLQGTGTKEQYGEVEYTDANVTFTLSEDLIYITWQDDQAPETDDGVVFELIEPAFSGDWWYSDTVDEAMGYFDDGHYVMHVTMGESLYSYVCDYDRAAATLTAVDPATLDPDSYSDFETYQSTATFTLQSPDSLLWIDDSGITGEGGILLQLAQ